MILNFILVIFLTAATIGIPAIWIIRDQLDRQVSSQLAQGQQAAQVLYESKQEEVANFAILTSQRPTLQELLRQGNISGLNSYLANLGNAADIDLVMICQEKDVLFVNMQQNHLLDACNQQSGYLVTVRDGRFEIWMIGSSPVEAEDILETTVVVGVQVDDGFVENIRFESGVEQIVWVGDQLVASSFAVQNEELTPASKEFRNGKNTYFSSQFFLDGTTIVVHDALDISEIITTQQRLVWILSIGMIGVVILGSVLGIFLSRKISRPLVDLADAAEKFSKGDLMSSVQIEAQVREVDLVAQSLENSRIELYQTMQKLEDEREWVNRLLESIVEGIVTLDDQERITYFSQGAEKITGWKRHEVLNLPCDQFFKLGESDKPFTTIIREPGALQKLVVKLADDRLATLSITGAYLSPSQGEESQTVFVFRDVSEEQLIHRMLGDFLANITHEFRTPLSALSASIELLMEQAHDLSRDELQELLNTLYLGALSLQTLIDNLLEGAKIEAGRFRISPSWTSLSEVISRVINTMQPLFDKYNQQLILELPDDLPLVYVDPRRVEQVLINLLSNASRHGPTNVKITIRVELIEDYVVVQVIDEGPGIPLDYKRSVFQRFSQVGYQSKNSKVGAGFGLSIVKTIIDAHDGQVGVEDNPGGGSKFWFTLMLAGRDESINR